MGKKIKLKDRSISIGMELRKYRKHKGKTLETVSYDTNIDVGQLSRFENGDFVFHSDNLQIYLDYLQIKHIGLTYEEELINRFSAAILKSPNNLDFATHLVSILEHIGAGTDVN